MTKQAMSGHTKDASTSSDAPNKRGKVGELRARLNSLNISRPIALGLMAVLICGALLVAYQSQAARVTAITDTGLQADTPDIVWLRSKVRETGGDISRLSTEDRVKADEAARRTTGMSATALFTNPGALAPMDPNKFQESRTAAWRAAQGR